MKIYIVQGSSGSYEDFEQWLVCAYESYDKAKSHADSADKRGTDIESELFKHRLTDPLYPEPKNEFDPENYNAYDGASYEVVELEMRY